MVGNIAHCSQLWQAFEQGFFNAVFQGQFNHATPLAATSEFKDSDL